MDELYERRIVLITGKGGVGRSTVAAALALAGGRAGKRVLLAEMGEPSKEVQSPLARHFALERFPHVEPIPIADGVKGVTLKTEVGTELFLQSVLRIGMMARLAMRTAPLLRLLHAAPSFYELGIFYHLLSLIQATRPSGEPEHQVILFDMPATGHALALTGLPQILLGLVPRGPIAEALRAGQKVLNDPKTGAAYVVTLPEALPVTEALELIDGLRETNMPIGGVIANRLESNAFDDAERAALVQIIAGAGEGRLFGVAGLDRIERARSAIDRLRLSVDVPIHELPERPEEGRALIDGLGGHVAEMLSGAGGSGS